MNVRITEVGPRDGLQNESATIPTETKIRFVDALSEAGFEEIEVSAFVSPDRVPQLKDAEQVFEGIRRRAGTIYSALVPNEKGLERALRAKAGKVSVFTAASETFNRKNVNASIQESIDRFKPVAEGAARASIPVRGYVSTAFWCPYEGKIAPDAVVAVVKRLRDIGIEEISIGDTIGKAVPAEVMTLLDRLLDHVDKDKLVMHFHDTYGTAIANVLASYERGISAFDSSAGGVGGCPFAPGASGNGATEDVIWALTQSGAGLGPDLGRVRAATGLLALALGAGLPPRPRSTSTAPGGPGAARSP